MSEIGKKLNYPRTTQIGEPSTQRYARKLTRTLDDLKAQLMRALKTYIDEHIENITINIGEIDHGNLLGLEDDDHTHYILADGTRVYTGTGDGFSDDEDLADASAVSTVSERAIKAYVDALLAYILASPVGSIIYIWENDEGDKFLQRLIPGSYGQVLVTAGAGARPFWDWVWESPGAEGSPSIVYYLVAESSVEAAKVTMNHEVAQSGAISIDYGSNLGPQSGWFEDYDRTDLDATASAAKITPDETAAVDLSGDLAVDVSFNPLRPDVSDSLGLTDSATVSVV